MCLVKISVFELFVIEEAIDMVWSTLHWLAASVHEREQIKKKEKLMFSETITNQVISWIIINSRIP